MSVTLNVYKAAHPSSLAVRYYLAASINEALAQACAGENGPPDSISMVCPVEADSELNRLNRIREYLKANPGKSLMLVALYRQETCEPQTCTAELVLETGDLDLVPEEFATRFCLPCVSVIQNMADPERFHREVSALLERALAAEQPLAAEQQPK